MPVGVSAYTPLANITLSSTASSVTFSSINGTLYRDLILVSDSINATATDGICYRFNSDSGSNYSNVTMEANGSSAVSGAGTSTKIFTSFGYSGSGTTSRSLTTLNIFDYRNTDKHKSTLIRIGTPATSVAAFAGRWANTAAITTIAVFLDGGSNFASGSTFALYGVSA
jgi:hypothetical protein